MPALFQPHVIKWPMSIQAPAMKILGNQEKRKKLNEDVHFRNLKNQLLTLFNINKHEIKSHQNLSIERSSWEKKRKFCSDVL